MKTKNTTKNAKNECGMSYNKEGKEKMWIIAEEKDITWMWTLHRYLYVFIVSSKI